MGDKDKKVMEAIHRILSKGNNAEVRKRQDGKITVYEVKKNIVAS